MNLLFKIIPGLSYTFSDNSLAYTCVLILKFWYFALTRKTFFRGREMRFKLFYQGGKIVVYIESNVDIAVLREVFILEEYRWNLPHEPKVIVDLGAHFGDTTLYYHLKYPNATILAVEPAPDTFLRLCKNTKDIPNIIQIQAGVADIDGVLNLYIGKSSFGPSFSPRADTLQTIAVPVYSLQTLLQMYNITRADIIKFDIEGAEEIMFADKNPTAFADRYIGEVHGDLISVTAELFVSKFKDFSIEKEILSNSERFILKAIKKS